MLRVRSSWLLAGALATGCWTLKPETDQRDASDGDLPAESGMDAGSTDDSGTSPEGSVGETSDPGDVPQSDGGTDGPICSPGLQPCGGACVDPMADPSNCGGCGVTCVPGDLCLSGACPRQGCVDSTAGAAPQSYDYVINTLSIDDNSSFSQPHTGFDVDNARSPTPPSRTPPDCGHQDFFSLIDTDQNVGTCLAGVANGGTYCQGGVDNQLPVLAQTLTATGQDLRATVSASVAQGRLAILVRLTDVNGTPGPSLNDCDVGVRVYLGRPLAADCSTLFNGSSVFAVDRSSLVDPGSLSSAVYSYRAQIVGGRLRVGANAVTDYVFNLGILSFAATPVALPIHGFQLRTSLSETGGTSGNLGGYLLRTETVAALRTAAPAYASLVDSVVSGLVDVATNSPPACGDSSPTAGGIGYGMGFTMARAVVAPSAVSGPQPGACGTPTTSLSDGGVDAGGVCPPACSSMADCDSCWHTGEAHMGGNYCCISGLCIYRTGTCDATMVDGGASREGGTGTTDGPSTTGYDVPRG